MVLKTLPNESGTKSMTAHSLVNMMRRKNHDTTGELLLKNHEENPKMLELLQQYDDIFQEPRLLPPERSIQHRIELLPDAIPKKQHPYRNLNKLIVNLHFPIPIIDELLDELHDAKYFPKIDLRSGYFQIRKREGDIPKTSFITHSGHYEFLVMHFGLCNAPSTFQALMNSIFEPYLRKFVLVFFHGILIYSKDWGMHLVHLKKVVELLRNHKLYAKRRKCSFAQLKVEFLGHIISWEGIATDPQKIESMVNWPIPTIVKALRGFLRLTAYYRGFIKGYGAINACGKGIGSVLMQGSRPIAYLSQHKKGNENRATDALSRIEQGEQEDHCSAITTQVPLWVQEIQSSYEGYTIPNLTIGPYLQNHHIEVIDDERFKVLLLLKDNLHQVQQRMKLCADKRITEREFKVGDKVFQKLQPYRQTSVSLKEQLKLSAKYYDPTRLIPRNNVGVPQVLIQWSYSSPDQATLEHYHTVAARFQGFDP
ncbi:Retrovirus-related Pol polyprotein from transposon [Sesamum angolense]|uniref:Retrovirus-related Pol polyprotein from transposon n=1 Tax=Sesamum angolense TaxID=2727404 RepID=A0AAE1T444_9LAMI|nr:Retrovirus-related Pol polyprotein from transposon [Sesamum angolense]